jgi:hypothetical protein
MTKTTTRTRAEAKRLMWEYYRENKQSLPSWIQQFREEILRNICLGHDVSAVFSSLIIL